MDGCVVFLYRFISLVYLISTILLSLQAAEDKANHLNRVKYKLEQNLDELEDSVEREKKVNKLNKGFCYVYVDGDIYSPLSCSLNTIVSCRG